MIKINDNFTKLSQSYLFSTIAKKIASFKTITPDAEVISLGIGDVTQPLSPEVIKALHTAVDEMASSSTFRGYAPECGYDFLKNTILENDYLARGIFIGSDEIFINDGAKSALGHFGDIISSENIVAISDPVYPAYIDTNVMDGRSGDFNEELGKWNKIVYLDCPSDKDFAPQLPENRADVIYLCSPNNPTGSVMNREQLTAWVEYAKANKSVIFFDSAYEAYISDPAIPRSIYEIDGAKEVAVEFRSFSKTAGFTGMRCGYTIVPKELMAYDKEGCEVALNPLWLRHQSTKFNGTAYIIQRAAEAIYTKEGKVQTAETVAYYMSNAKTIREGLTKAGFRVYGGENAPYIWLQIPNNMDSWSFFDKLLAECQIVGTPGVGFGPSGEGYFRLTAFAQKENVDKAMQRITNWKI